MVTHKPDKQSNGGFYFERNSGILFLISNSLVTYQHTLLIIIDGHFGRVSAQYGIIKIIYLLKIGS